VRQDDITFFRSTPSDRPFYFSMTGITRCNENYHIHRDSSFETVIEYIVSGNGTLRTNNEIYYPTAGQVYILRQKAMHDYYADPKDPWIKLFLNIRGPLAETLLDMYGLGDAVVVDGEGMEDDFRRILDITVDSSLSHDEIFVKCATEFHKLVINLADKNIEHAVDSEMKLISDYIAARFDRIVSNHELARLIGRSEDYTIKKFKSVHGTTPYEYQISEKIVGACNLLKNTDLPIGKIAAQFGYTDQRYFANLFKKRCNMTPSQYRNSK